MQHTALRFRLYIIAAILLLIFSKTTSKSLHQLCDLSKYRSPDGFCNNLQHPHWGASNSTYLRLPSSLSSSSPNDEFSQTLPPIDEAMAEISPHLRHVHNSYALPRNGIFQVWTELLMMDLDLPSSIGLSDEIRNEATAYLDASFLYSRINFTMKSDDGDLIYYPCTNCWEVSAYAKTAVLLLINEHNRIASLLRRKNVQWDAETVFEESRRILVAEIQHITYTQYLPLLLGEIPNTPPGETNERLNPWDVNEGYDSETRTGIYDSFSAVIVGLLRSSNFEEASDVHDDIVNSLKSFLIDATPNFRNALGEGIIKGILRSSRRRKIRSYQEWRDFCASDERTKAFYSSQYQLNENQNLEHETSTKSNFIDLVTRVLTETKLPKGLFGPTFACIVTLQFENLRRGDRLWYTNQNFDTSFSAVQLKELRTVTITSLVCSNNQNLEVVQKNAFLVYNTESNPSVLCSLEFPLKLKSWEEKISKSKMTKKKILQDAIRRAELDVSRRWQTEYLLWSHKGGVDPKSAAGTAAAFSKPNRDALLMANSSLLFEYASQELLQFLDHRSLARRHKRQLFDGDDSIIGLSDELGGNFLQDLDISNISPNVLPESSNCPVEIGACDPSYPYRSLSGYCNNLRKPNYGKSLTTFARLLPPAYENGISKPRLHSVMGIPLPSARLVSSMMHLDISHLDSKHSMMLMQFAQFVDHDITFTPVHRGFFTSIPDCRPCDSAVTIHPECMPIEVPAGDPYYPQVNRTSGKRFCLPFMRSLPGQQRLGSREQINQNSAFLDASQVYGDNSCLARQLRTYFNGHLNTTVSLYGDKELLPQSPTHPECRSSSGYCFIAGDGRASEQPGLTAIHTIFVREHNRIADGLRTINPGWEDERIYQQARKIVNAEYQHIVYNEFLPRILGHTAMSLYGLSLESPGEYFKGYSEECNPGVFSEFAAAAFRIGHSLLRPFIPRMSPTYENLEPSILLRNTFFNPDIIYQRNIIDEIMRGLYNTPIEELDQFITKEITNHLFEDKKVPHSGIDLPALNVQRARDHGIPSYNDYRAMCNLKRAVTWDDFSRELPQDVIVRLKRIYPTVDDVDLFPAGISERPIHGGLVGPTFACLIGLQFRQLRNCDRFWYETPNTLLKFTPEQLSEIRKTTLSKIICDNMDIPVPLQRYVMDLPDDENPRLQCQSIPTFNLHAWKEPERVGCNFRGLPVGVGESYFPSPCTSCICTPQGMKCATIRVTNCLKLLEEVGQNAVLKDEVCAVQCASYITQSGSSPIIRDQIPGPPVPNQGRNFNFYLAAGLKPPALPAVSPRRKVPSTRSFKIRDYSIVVG